MNQRGSHHILHSDQAPVLVTEPHGHKERSINASVANQFCKSLLDRAMGYPELGSKRVSKNSP